MSNVPKRFFLQWLLYAVVVTFLGVAATYAGIPQAVMAFDPTYMCAGLAILYVVAELYMGLLVWKTNSVLDRARHGWVTLKTAYIDRIWQRNSFGAWVGDMAVIVGLVGTFWGIIETFKPFFGMGTVDVTKLQGSMGQMFTGIAIAIFPSLVGVVVKGLMDISSRILESATSELTLRTSGD